MIRHTAILDVPPASIARVSVWLAAHRRRIGTRKGRRALGPYRQAVLVLRWLRDDVRCHRLAADLGVSTATVYRYLHEALEVIAAHAPDLHQVLAHGQEQGWSHVGLDGTLIETDRCRVPNPDTGHDLWFSGKHRRHGGNVQVLTDPTGFPIWTSPVEPGCTHDLTAARTHVLPALYAAAAAGLPTLTDKGYDGAGIGVHHPTKNLPATAPDAHHVDTRTRNALLGGLRGPKERGNAILKTRWTALNHIRLCPRRIGTIVAAALVLSTLERGNY